MGLNGQLGMELTKEPLKCDNMGGCKSGQQLEQLLVQLLTPKPPGSYHMCLHS